MFYHHQSNQMELLAEQLSNILGNDKSTNPFVEEKVLVQSPGMSQWLKIVLAQRLGVMANIDFPLPSSFIWQLYQLLVDDLPAQSAFNKDQMSWKLYSILPNFLDHQTFAPLKHYLANDPDGLMLLQLSEKIADVFDQYLMYRPDWICQWEAGEDQIVDGDHQLQPWQPILWRALSAHTEQLSQSPYHRANLHDRVLERLDEALKAPEHPLHQELPRRLFIFGISALPQQQLQLLDRLAQLIDVHLMLFNPCAHYWGDIVDQKQLAKVQARFKDKKHLPVEGESYLTVGNPLLASWGKLGRDYHEQLLEVEAKPFDYFIEPQADTLLAHIQADIYHLQFRGELEPLTPLAFISDKGKVAVASDDDSLCFHGCHSPLREVEVLHDSLLRMFAADSSLTPKDIIVMMPDVSQYSPYINAVFNSGINELYNRIPYAISDQGFSVENPIVNSFLQLMKLPESRFSASELLDLLSVPATIRALGLDEDDIELIRHWINQVGIRWGIDAQHKQSLQLPADELNSWSFGLKRLLLGYAMGEPRLTDGILPFKHVEGQSAEVLGKLVRFVDRLIYYRRALAELGTIEAKVELAQLLLSELYQPDSDEEQAVNTIRQVLLGFAEQQQLGNCTEVVSQKVFGYYLAQGFNDKGVGQRFLAGQVNFCTLMPMRSIPFRVICLLGMNDADYPRYVAPIGFDLMASGKARKGDRSRRLDDRYLLLEAMLSARDKLYVSYVGRSMQDNSEKMPSVLISELLEYCEQAFLFPASHQLRYEHPLQPFDPSYFEQDSAVDSYCAHWFRYVNQQDSPSAPKVMPSIEVKPHDPELELNELLKFILHPVRYFFNRTLQLHFAAQTALEQDDETFVLNGLGRYQLLEQLSQSQLSGAEVGDFAHVNGAGQLPHRGVGELAFDGLNAQAQTFVASLNETSLTRLDAVEVNLAVDCDGQSLLLLGWIKNLTTDGLLFYRPAKITAKDRLTAWLSHLAMAAMGRPVKTKHIGLTERVEFKPLPADRAKAVLAQWLGMYLAGLQQPLAFFIRSSEAWCQTQKMTEVAKQFNGSSFVQVPGEGDDVYIQRVYQDVDNLPADFNHWAELIFTPLFDNQLGGEQA